jgi:lipoate---protein ligase
LVLNILLNTPSWEILDSGKASAEANMCLDKKLLSELGSRKKALLHFYDWETESATYGFFLNPKEHLNLEGVKKRSLALARRPTGGGIVFHLWDLAFSVLVPASSPFFSSNTLDNYRFVNTAVLKAVGEFLNPAQPLTLTGDDEPALDRQCQRFCMAQPTKYDVLLSGRKIAGAAQRKTKEGFLHQGTIALVMPPRDYLQDVLLPATHVEKAMRAYTQPLLKEGASSEDIQAAKRTLRTLLSEYLIQGT